VFGDFLQDIQHRFTPETYNLLTHNCNHFTNECSMFLLGEPIPDRILHQLEEVLSTPLGALLRPAIAAMQSTLGGAGGRS